MNIGKSNHYLFKKLILVKRKALHVWTVLQLRILKQECPINIKNS
jgi:hypothetical protein